MYGMVNKAIEDLVCTSFGPDKWEQIKAKAGVEEEMFLSHEGYPDSMTYGLVGAASEVLGLPAEKILNAFGRHWILKTAREGYGDLLAASGRNLPDFLAGLPNFHSRIKLMFPNLKPPRFSITERTESSLLLHYQTHRDGLAPFVVGVLDGLGEMYKTPVTVEHVAHRTPESQSDTFRVAWSAPTP
jgi:hypothetical protein